MKGISPNFGHRCIWVNENVLIRFWGQKVNVTAGNDLKNGWIHYLCNY